MSHLFFTFLTLLLADQQPHKTDGSTTAEMDVLTAPQGWRKERIGFPLGFAPTLPYTGFEDIRFAPGWSDEKAEDFWSYVFVWYVDHDPQLNTASLQRHVKLYFDGLMETSDAQVVISSNSDPVDYVGHVVAKDAFFTQDKMQLNFTVRISECAAQQKYLVLFRLSPQKPQHAIWQALNQVEPTIDCAHPAEP
ncbi:hypothetical protein [Marinicella sp. W31]|uniref:hypothetical protein n=1 Tax=Marinicella sp. W31 TaxID=3023713 RepID=UPI00375782BF